MIRKFLYENKSLVTWILTFLFVLFYPIGMFLANLYILIASGAILILWMITREFIVDNN